MRVISSTCLRCASDQRFYPPGAAGENSGRISRRHGPCAGDSMSVPFPAKPAAERRCPHLATDTDSDIDSLVEATSPRPVQQPQWRHGLPPSAHETRAEEPLGRRRRGPRAVPGEVPAPSTGVAGRATRTDPRRREAAAAPGMVRDDLVRPGQTPPAHGACTAPSCTRACTTTCPATSTGICSSSYGPYCAPSSAAPCAPCGRTPSLSSPPVRGHAPISSVCTIAASTRRRRPAWVSCPMPRKSCWRDEVRKPVQARAGVVRAAD